MLGGVFGMSQSKNCLFIVILDWQQKTCYELDLFSNSFSPKILMLFRIEPHKLSNNSFTRLIQKDYNRKKIWSNAKHQDLSSSNACHFTLSYKKITQESF